MFIFCWRENTRVDNKADWYCKKERHADHEASSSCCNRNESQKERRTEGIRNRRVIFWPVGIFASYVNNFLSSASVIRTANCMISYNNGKPRYSDNILIQIDHVKVAEVVSIYVVQSRYVCFSHPLLWLSPNYPLKCLLLHTNQTKSLSAMTCVIIVQLLWYS